MKTRRQSIYILADLNNSKKVTNNIIMNSIKYITNKKGFINIESKDDNEHIQICISDNGIGIPLVPYIFERFYRSDSPETRQKGGSGLGLSIAEDCEDQNGEIWYFSRRQRNSIYISFRKYEEYKMKKY